MHAPINHPMRNHHVTKHPSIRRAFRKRRGAIIVLTTFMMMVMMASLTLSLDVGYMYTLKTQLQRSVDAAALAGAGALVEGQEAANAQVVEYLVRNPIGKQATMQSNDPLQTQISAFLADHSKDMDVALGHWNPVTRQLELTAGLPSSISVSMTYADQPLFFGRLLGRDNFTVSAESIAMYQPRDIMLVLDLSGSMNDDSEFRNINSIGQPAIETNLQKIHAELGSPVYGNMQFTPQYITVVGAPPQNASQPQITVEYRYKSVYITSSKDLSNVVLQYSNGSTQKFGGLSGLTGTFAGSGWQKKPIYKVWVKSGANASGEGPGYGEPFDFSRRTITQTIKTALGLDSVSYPYPSGSWSNYISYVKSYRSYNKSAGYRYKFGYMNLINYWLEKKPRYSQTPDLWKVSAQPVTAVKDAVDVFMDYIREVDTNDRVGLAVYNSSSGNGKLESGLTTDFDQIVSLADQRQAGHYHVYTNIGAGMQTAREELDANGRPGAFKMVVLMTDGKANWVNGSYSTSGAMQYVLDEAQLAADRRYPIVTISLGSGADLSLMQQVADLTPQGHHFKVPGGQSVEEYSVDLKQVFRDIADSRPLKLVK